MKFHFKIVESTIKIVIEGIPGWKVSRVGSGYGVINNVGDPACQTGRKEGVKLSRGLGGRERSGSHSE